MVKGQTKVQQTAFMLVAITLLFVLVGLFVVGFRFSSLKSEATNLQEENAMLTASKLANTPEFSCGRAFGSNRLNCIDSDKVMALKRNIVGYEDFWGVSDIKIRKVYPEPEEGECYLGNYPDCDTISLLSEDLVGSYTSVFVTLCRKEADGDSFYDKCELARLMVAYEEQ